MGLLDKLKRKARDPELREKVTQAAQKAGESYKARDRSQGRTRFAGGPLGSVGYPYDYGHPMYGSYAQPGWYDTDGTRFDSDGDGVPDAQDFAPYDPGYSLDAGYPMGQADDAGPVYESSPDGGDFGGGDFGGSDSSSGGDS
jgi:hypothetical protein